MKFDESIDVSLGNKFETIKGGDFSLRTIINLPNGSGKKNKVAVLWTRKDWRSKKSWCRYSGIWWSNRKIASGKFDLQTCLYTSYDG